MRRIGTPLLMLAGAGLIIDARRLGGSQDAAAKPSPTWRSHIAEGVLVPLRRAIAGRTGVPWAADFGEGFLAIETGEKSVIPIWPTESGQFFYRDSQLAGKKFRIEGRSVDGLPGIEPVRIRALRGGKAYDLFYWCDVCAIRMHYKADCTCCQGPVELREIESP